MTKIDDKLGYLSGQRCLGSKCKALDTPLRLQYRCALCDEQLHSAIFGDEPECTTDTEEPTPTFIEVQGHLDAVKRYCDANGVPRKVRESAVEIQWELQKHSCLARLGIRHSSNTFLRNTNRVIPCSAIL
jgi:hypothetical protein